jgi:tetratricopeptide (TPR) repeat protein
MNGKEIESAHRSITFQGRSDESIIVSFEPDDGQCLYVIRPEDTSFRKLPPLLKEAGHLSALDRIDTSADASNPFLNAIGLHYPDDWCTYYEKADLARQNKNYERVIELWTEAQAKGFSPGANFEYMLFLDAYTQLGRWDDAAQLTFEAVHVFPILRRPMCDYWAALPATSAMDAASGQVRLKLNCAFD